MRLDWRDGLPTLTHRDRTWRLDRWWIRDGGLHLGLQTGPTRASRQHGLRDTDTGYCLETMGGDLHLTPEEVRHLALLLDTEVSLPDRYYDSPLLRPSFTEDEVPSVCQVIDGEVEYLVLSGYHSPDPLPVAQILQVTATWKGGPLSAMCYLALYRNCAPMTAPVIYETHCGGWPTTRHFYHCQVLIIGVDVPQTPWR